MMIRIGPRVRQLHAVAVLADRQEHTIRDLTLTPMFGSTLVSNATSTRDAIQPLIDAGYVRIVRRTPRTGGQGSMIIYQLAANYLVAEREESA
jgi:hypothetical protein